MYSALSHSPMSSGGGGGGGGGALYDDDDWDIGEWESAEYMEEGDHGEGGVEEDDNEEEEEEEEDEEEGAVEQMPLENAPAARGTRLSLDGLTMAPAQTARPAELWVQLGCARCGQVT